MTSMQQITVAADGTTAATLHFSDLPREARDRLLSAAMLVAIHAESGQVAAEEGDDLATDALLDLVSACDIAWTHAAPASPDQLATIVADHAIRRARAT